MLASFFMTAKDVVRFFARCLGTVVFSVLLATQSARLFRTEIAVAADFRLALTCKTWLTSLRFSSN